MPTTEQKKEIGIIGLGRMGGNLARRLVDLHWRVIGYNRTTAVTDALVEEGILKAGTVAEVIEKLSTPRIVWLMVPAGEAVDAMLFGSDGVVPRLTTGDIVIDGGNSFFKDTQSRAKKFEGTGIHFLDIGVSGGPGGARNGPCLMIGGDASQFAYLDPLFKALALPGGYACFPGAGAGHFVKMVHNGIEYGMMQSIAEGFTILKQSPFAIDLIKAAELYNHGSVVTSRLVGWLKDGLVQYGHDLQDVSGKVGYTGEGEWTVAAAKELGVSAESIALAFQFRVQSQTNPSYTGKILSTMRNQFGHHRIDGSKT